MRRMIVAVGLVVAAALAGNAAQSVPWGGVRKMGTAGGGSGTVTAVRQGYGLLFTEDPLTDTGTVGWDSTGFKTWLGTESTNVSVMAGVRARFTNLFGDGSSLTSVNAATLQGKDTTALWNAKTLQTWDTTDIQNCAGESAAAHEGAGVDQQARDSAAQALTEARRDSVRIDGKLATAGKAADATKCDSAYKAALAYGIISNGDSSPILHGSDTTGWVYFNAAGDSVWTRWLIWHGTIGEYHSVGVHETCATNENLSVDFNGGNVHSVVVGATLDTLTLTNGSDGGRYQVTVLGNATATIVWKSDASAIWWPDSTAPTRSGICNVYCFSYDGEQDVYIGAAGTNFGPP